MAIPILLHIANEDTVACEVEAMPDAGDQIIIVYNPMRKDGKDLHYLEEDVTVLIVPWHRVNFVQVLSSEEHDEIIGFIRE